MTANVLIACFKREMFRIGILRKVSNIYAMQDLLKFELNGNEWKIPFPQDEMDNLQTIESENDFIEYLAGNGTCNDNFDLSRILEEDCGSLLFY